jgi:Ca2+/H+ antiporter
MFEISIFCVIVLAIGYWVALWLMGRHDDVLHGDFVQTELGPEPAATPSQPASSQPKSSQPKSSQPKSSQPKSSQPTSQPMRPDRAESLQSLLAAIKRDLKDAAQI